MWQRATKIYLSLSAVFCIIYIFSSKCSYGCLTSKWRETWHKQITFPPSEHPQTHTNPAQQTRWKVIRISTGATSRPLTPPSSMCVSMPDVLVCHSPRVDFNANFVANQTNWCATTLAFICREAMISFVVCLESVYILVLLLPNVDVDDVDSYAILLLFSFSVPDAFAFIQINATLWLFPVSISLCQSFRRIRTNSLYMMMEHTKAQSDGN